MPVRPPWSLWRSILVDLWRLILLTTVVLVTVISFAALIKPLADGKLTPGETLKFMGLAMVPMLQYALPFAAGFGATLAYHRLAADNEVTAAYAGGISHRTVLMPAVLSGVVLAGVLVGLNQWVMPRFLRAMEQLVARDLGKILLSGLQRGESVPVGDNLLLYADAGVAIEPAPRSGARQEFVLKNAALIELDKRGRITKDFTTDNARLWIMDADRPSGSSDDAGASLVVVQPGTVVIARETTLGKAEEMQPFAFTVPGGFNDNPKYLTFQELRELRLHPERMNWMEAKRRSLAMCFAERTATATIRDRLQTAGRLVLNDDQGGRVVVRAKDITLSPPFRWSLAPSRADGRIEIELSRPRLNGDGTDSTVILARTGGIYTRISSTQTPGRLVSFRLEAEDTATVPRTGDPAPPAGGSGQQAVFKLEGLSFQDDPTLELLDAERHPVSDLLVQAQRRLDAKPPDKFFAGPARSLAERVDRLNREITSKQHERFAMAAACLVMVVTGAITSLRLGPSLPLAVYLWSFFPALGAIISISSGQQLTRDLGLPGLVVLWGGVAALGAYAALTLRKVARH